MSLFIHIDYRKALQSLVYKRKQIERRFGFHTLATAARIQRPYLSKVMKGTANLSSDQLYLISRCLKLNEEEQDFLQLLLEHARTSVASRRLVLEEKIRRIAAQHLQVANHLQAKVIGPAPVNGSGGGIEAYYLNPILQVIHVALSIPAIARAPQQLTSVFGIQQSRLHEFLRTLERLGFAKCGDNGWEALEPSLHLPKESPIYRVWRNQLHQLAAQRTSLLDLDEIQGFATVFSADDDTYQELRDQFLQYLRRAESRVRDATPKRVYYLSFELFPWL